MKNAEPVLWEKEALDGFINLKVTSSLREGTGSLRQLGSHLLLQEGGQRGNPTEAFRLSLLASPPRPHPRSEAWDLAKATPPPGSHTGLQVGGEDGARVASLGMDGVLLWGRTARAGAARGGVGRGWEVRRAGHQPSSPRPSPPRAGRNPQDKNSTPELPQAAPPLAPRARSPPGPLRQAPLSPQHPPPPSPARRGALVRQGGGRPTASGRGPRAGLGPGPPHLSPGGATSAPSALPPAASALWGGVSPKWGAREAQAARRPPAQAPSGARGEW